MNRLGAHRCEGDDCTRMVSATKRVCLHCLAKEFRLEEWKRGNPIDLLTAKRILREAAGV